MSERFNFTKVILWLIIAIALLILFYALLARPYHMRWGATREESIAAMPGDHFITATSEHSTRAITIYAPAPIVWEWIIQLGQGRGGFYSYDWLENLFAAKMVNSDQILPTAQIQKLGDHVSFMENGPYNEVTFIEPGKVLIIGNGWTFVLKAQDQQTTRLIVRYTYELGNNLANTIYYYTIFEEAHFIMEAGMMMGIKHRAEMDFQNRDYTCRDFQLVPHRSIQ